MKSIESNNMLSATDELYEDETTDVVLCSTMQTSYL